MIQKWENNKILRSISKEVDLSKKINNKLLQSLEKELNQNEEWKITLWVAAPQIWFNERVIIIKLIIKITQKWEIQESKDIIMINPEILEKSKETGIDFEGCLSVPNIEWKVERSKVIKVWFYDINKKYQWLVLSDLNARVVQHEIDHLDWILFIDKLI